MSADRAKHLGSTGSDWFPFLVTSLSVKVRFSSYSGCASGMGDLTGLHLAIPEVLITLTMYADCEGGSIQGTRKMSIPRKYEQGPRSRTVSGLDGCSLTSRTTAEDPIVTN